MGSYQNNNKKYYFIFSVVIVVSVLILLVYNNDSSSDSSSSDSSSSASSSSASSSSDSSSSDSSSSDSSDDIKYSYDVPKLYYEGGCWQGKDGCNNTGTIWGSSDKTPWNRKYGLSCKYPDDHESDKIVIGPVSHFNYHKPKIALTANGNNPCGNDKIAKLRVYDYTDNNNIQDITSAMYNFDTVTPYDGFNNYIYDGRVFT